jgi:transcriptional regulator with XRE-family HTH domain
MMVREAHGGLASWRKGAGLSQAEAARRVKEKGGGTRCKQSTVARWEAGHARPDFPNAVALEAVTDGAEGRGLGLRRDLVL